MRASLLVLSAVAATGVAWAGPEQDLAAAVRQYETFEPELAARALRAVLAAPDLDAPTCARAHLYLGLSLATLGDAKAADAEFEAAFLLAPKLPVPPDTLPDIARRTNVARAVAKARLAAEADLARGGTGEPARPVPEFDGFTPPPPPPVSPVTPPAPPPPEPPAPKPVLVGTTVEKPAPEKVAPPVKASTPGAKSTAERPGWGIGAGLRLLYVPQENVIGPVMEVVFTQQRAGVVLSAFPGSAWGLGVAARLTFGPDLKVVRLDFGFDAGLLVFPSRTLLAYEVNAHLVSVSFAAGPVRISLRALSLGLYGSLFTDPMTLRFAVTSGVGVSY